VHGIEKSDDVGELKALWPWRRRAGAQEDGRPPPGFPLAALWTVGLKI